MAGISTKAVGKLENRHKYNSIELNSAFDLYSYEARYRNLDPQIGRWWQIDPMFGESIAESPYVSMGNNPISNQDPLGDYFFGLFGSTREQRQAARAFAKELEGTEGYTDVKVNNITRKSVNVQYTSNYQAYDPESGQVVQTASSRTQHFRENGRPDFGNTIENSAYDREFDLAQNTILHPDGTRSPRPFPGTAEYVAVEAMLVPLPPLLKAFGKMSSAAKSGTTIIGEGMARVEAAASKVPGAKILNDMPTFTGTAEQVTSQMMQYNRKWILNEMRSGRTILDIGRDATRTNPSIFYQMEQSMLRNYQKLHPGSLNVVKP